MPLRHTQLTTAAIEQTLDEWRAGSAIAGVFALLPEAEQAQLPVLQAACRQRGIELVGGIFPALVMGDGFVTAGAWLLGFERLPPYFLLPACDAPASETAASILAAIRQALAAQPPESGKPTLFLTFDSMVPNVASLLDAIYLELANRIEYAGVNAGSESFQPMPCLFDSSRLLGNAVLGLLLPQDRSPVLAHGFPLPERTMSATSAQGNRIAMIDWRPAFTVYQELMRAEYGIELTAENFYEYAVHFPFGILRAGGEVLVRIPVGLADDGALYCVGEIPEHAMLVVLKAPEADAGGCVEHLAHSLRGIHDFQAGDALLTFYCAGRRMHLGAGAETELAALQAATGAGVMAGAVTLGEIGSIARRGYPLFHNATLVCARWDRR